MGRLPGAVFVVDIMKEHLAVNEAIKLHIPIIAMVDTNSDPDIPDYIIPCNDDSARTIQLIASQIADAVIEGAAEREAQVEEDLLDQVNEEAAASEGADTEVSAKPKLRSRRKKAEANEVEATLEPQDEATADAETSADEEE